MQRKKVLPMDLHDEFPNCGEKQCIDVYLASEVDAFMSASGLTKLIDRIDELQKQVATLDRSNSRLRQKIDRLSS